MHFIAADFNWTVDPDPGPDLAAARRLAAGEPVRAWPTPAGTITCAGNTCGYTTAGPLTVVLASCESRHDTGIDERAASVAAEWPTRGAAALRALDGSYQAFVVDAERRQVSVMIDRFAIGQLYYFAAGERLVVSSDLTALISAAGVPRRIDSQAIYDYVFFHCIPAPRTIYEGVCKLEPAAVLAWDDNRVSTSVWWSPEFAQADAPVPQAAALLDTLEEAVAVRAHGNVGAFLSGGLDSSSVAGMLSRRVTPAPTFTIGFAAAEYDESAFAQVSAGHFKTAHHEYFVTPADISDAWPRIAAFYAEPFGNSSVIPTYYCARHAAENGIDALLAGDGGDELFGGNERYLTQTVFERYFSVPHWIRATLEAGYRWLPPLGRLPVAGKGKRYIEQALMGLPDRLQSYNFLNRFPLDNVFEPAWLETVDPQMPWTAWRERYAQAGDIEQLHAMLYLDWKFTLADNDLVKVTTMCELAGVEVRYPMLDQRVVDFAARVPAPALNPGGQLRGYYKQAMRGFLPQAVLDKSKHGFGLPFGVWMRDDPALNDLAESALLQFVARGIVRRSFIDEAIRLLRSDSPGYYGELIWIFVTLELWLDQHA